MKPEENYGAGGNLREESLSAILAEMREWSTDENDALARYADRIERANVRALALLAEGRVQLEAKAESEKRWACEYFDLARRREDALVHCRQYAQKIERENEEGETRLDAEEIIATVDNEFAGIRPDRIPGNAAAIREALRESCAILAVVDGGEYSGEIDSQLDKNTAALAAPARNCDVPERTLKELARAFRDANCDQYENSSEDPRTCCEGRCVECVCKWMLSPAKGGAE